ncbi:hypothetical protein MPSI1_002762 [Malassezia psittaci]|uniref:Catalase n=1 Tax=Malassezia psittaci TaxID=1821823 RepID=A0AAF0JEJ6_9BASI|nr:hypothetical protein MPSI1_002762 [Malassezia psittaci]
MVVLHQIVLGVLALFVLVSSAKQDNVSMHWGQGGDPQQRGGDGKLTTDQGMVISDNQNSLKSGSRGPTLLEDFVLREKIFSFDHERIPERIVHARGSAAHGYFEATEDISELSYADVFKKGKKTPLFARFSTVAGGAGSVDTPRDVRGFAVKFYTDQGIWDLVGNDIPVFFIQDAIKFPDLIHSVKMESDRGYPQAASAHDTFWDWATLMPESTHMLMWTMSDRGIPRSLRMMQGFGIHTFQLVNAKGESHFVKFHWKPKLGVQSTIWDETTKLQGADNDYHRKDLFESIMMGAYPEWELGIQVFDKKFAEEQEYDVLDSTKIIPEEVIPVKIIGKMVLNRNPDNYFAETEQVAFCPSHIPPGIDFSDDPLLQGRLFSYLDTQKSRLGTPNFWQLPINHPKVPVENFQRDGMMQMNVPKGRANYEPNSLYQEGEPTGPRACPFLTGLRTSSSPTGPRERGPKLRVRDERFADHYSQARMFWKSLTTSEQNHTVGGFVFELSKVTMPQVPKRAVANLRNVDQGLAQRVADGLGIDLPEKSKAAKEPVDMPASPALSIHRNQNHTIEGRNIGILISNGSDANTVRDLVNMIKQHKGRATIVAPMAHGIKLSDGSAMHIDSILAGSPSVLYDAAAVVLTKKATDKMLMESAAVQWVQDAFGHLKAIGYTEEAKPLLKKGGVDTTQAGVTQGFGNKFITNAGMRFWHREPMVRTLY